MNHISRILELEIWKYLPITTLRQLSLINKRCAQIFLQATTWSFLLYRDFDATSDDAQQQYMKYTRVLNYFAPVFPICTVDAVKMIADIIPRMIWYDIYIDNKATTFNCLSTYTVLSILRNDEHYQSDESSDSDLDYIPESDDDDGSKWNEPNQLKALVRKGEKWLNKRYPGVFGKFFEMYHARTNRKSTIDYNIHKFGQVPAKVYVGKQRKHVNINLDLIKALLINMHHRNKRKIYNKAENLLISAL